MWLHPHILACTHCEYSVWRTAHLVKHSETRATYQGLKALLDLGDLVRDLSPLFLIEFADASGSWITEEGKQ